MLVTNQRNDHFVFTNRKKFDNDINDRRCCKSFCHFWFFCCLSLFDIFFPTNKSIYPCLIFGFSNGDLMKMIPIKFDISIIILKLLIKKCEIFWENGRIFFSFCQLPIFFGFYFLTETLCWALSYVDIISCVCVCVCGGKRNQNHKKTGFRNSTKKFCHFCCCSFHCCWLLLRFFVVVLKPIDNFLKLSSICDDQTNLVVVVDEIIQSSWI